MDFLYSSLYLLTGYWLLSIPPFIESLPDWVMVLLLPVWIVLAMLVIVVSIGVLFLIIVVSIGVLFLMVYGPAILYEVLPTWVWILAGILGFAAGGGGALVVLVIWFYGAVVVEYGYP